MRLSIALATRNRPQELRRCLESLREQSFQPAEIIVSDDSEAHFWDKTRETAVALGATYQAGPRRGLYANRNAAAVGCTGTHIRTVDDDHTFPAGHLELCRDAILRDGACLWTTGEATFVDGKYTAQVDAANQLHPAGVGESVKDHKDNWGIADGSTTYPREVFARGCRMVEAFGFGSSYLEFGAYLYMHGFHSRCIDGAKVEHRVSSDDVPKRDCRSVLFSSLCFNIAFRPNSCRAFRYLTTTLCRRPTLLGEVPSLLRLVRRRWRLSR